MCWLQLKFDWICAYLERLEVVDEYVWHPEVVDEVEVDRDQLVLVLDGPASRTNLNEMEINRFTLW